MANLFDPAQSPTIEPERIVAGDFIQWRRTDLSADYPSSLYTLTYIARRNVNSITDIQVVGSTYGSDYLFSINSQTSASFAAGYYYWQLEALQVSSGNRIVIDRGNFTVVADLDSDCADPRSHAEIMVAKIESLLSGKADNDVANYSIAGRSLTKMSFDELVKARDYYKAEFRKEQIADKIRKGEETGNTIKVRF